MAILYGLGALWEVPGVRRIVEGVPILAALLFGAVAFPLVKTIFETFDGSQGFFRRVARNYRNPLLFGRGAVVGLGLGLAIGAHGPDWEMGRRVAFGFLFGASAYSLVNLVADWYRTSDWSDETRIEGRVQPWRVYLVQGLLGGFIGAALGFYFDAAQLKV